MLILIRRCPAGAFLTANLRARAAADSCTCALLELRMFD